MEYNSEEQLTLFAAVSPVKTFPEQEKEKGLTANDQVYTPKCCGLLASVCHDTIDQHKPNWSKTRSLTDKRKRMANKALKSVESRAVELGYTEFEYLENLLSAMAQDPFYSGTQPSRDKPNGYQWTIDQVLRADILAQAIDRLSGD